MKNEESKLSTIVTKKLLIQTSIPSLFIDIADGDLNSALFLHMCLEWGKESEESGYDGWFYKSPKDWEIYTNSKYDTMIRARERLGKIIEERTTKFNGEKITQYRVNKDAMMDKIEEIYGGDENE